MEFKSMGARCSSRLISVATGVKLSQNKEKYGQIIGEIGRLVLSESPEYSTMYKSCNEEATAFWYFRPKIAAFSGNRF